jgi:hypothetical protein
LHHQLPAGLQHRHRNRVPVDIQTDIFQTLYGVFLSVGFRLLLRPQQPQPTRKGRSFIMRGRFFAGFEGTEGLTFLSVPATQRTGRPNQPVLPIRVANTDRRDRRHILRHKWHKSSDSSPYICKKYGRPVRTRTADLYRVKGPRTRTSNNLKSVGDRGSTRKCR